MSDETPPAFDPLVIGLTRPPTIWGVPYIAAMFNGSLTICLFIAFADLRMLLVCIPTHMVLYFAALIDIRYLDILRVLAGKCPRTLNKSFWGSQSYSM